MRKLTLDPELLTVQSFRTTTLSDPAVPTLDTQTPDSPWCGPSMGGTDCTY